MPLLSAEPDVFPPTLFDDSRERDGNWWALYTLSRQEKQLCRRLLAQETAFYSPTVSRRYRSPGGRARTSHVPLFPNYVFVYGGEQDRYAAVRTGCVSRCLPVAEPESLLLELRQIRQLITAGIPLTPEDQLQPGMLVRVKHGPFQGVQGQVVERRGETRLVVAVNFIQRGASLELGDWEFEPVV